MFRKRRGIQPEERSISIGDPGLLTLFGLGVNDAGVTVSEHSSLGLSAVFRAVSLLAGTVAGLPLKTFRKQAGGAREQTSSFLDDPGGVVGVTRFSWKETILVHLLLHGNCYLRHIYGGGGQILGLQPIHPGAVTIDTTSGFKTFRVSLQNGQQEILTSLDMTHVMGLGSDGIRGYSPITLARNVLGTSIAGEQAAARQFKNGLMIPGYVSAKPNEPGFTVDEAKVIKQTIRDNATGPANAGSIPVFNKVLEFHKLSMSSVDAQFIESRGFQISEVARLFGVPSVLLMDSEKSTTFGTGISEIVRGFQKFTLIPWTRRIEEQLSTLLDTSMFAEFSFEQLLQGTPKEEVELLALQVEKGLLTLDEARRIMNLPPLPDNTPAVEEEVL